MSYPPTTSINISNNKRRKSFLDYGGNNSINNFVSSYQKAQNFLNIGIPANPQQQTHPIYPTFSNNSIDSEELQSEQSNASNAIRDIDSNYIQHANHNEIIDEESQLLIKKPGSVKFGKSTSAQTIFNSINTLVGIGILSLPLAFRLAGWIPGFVILLCCAISTNITAKLLGKILNKHPNLKSYGDIAKFSYGHSIHVIVSIIFSMDLLGASLSLVLLFSDSFNILFNDINKVFFKFLICLIVFILCLLPLNILSMFSLLGIISTSGVVVLIISCGFLTLDSPGSLINFQHTSIWPQDPKHVLLALGILICPWGGHPVFPELFREMKTPSKYNKCISITFIFTYFLDLIMATVGLLMFGLGVEDEVTKNIMKTMNYPSWVSPTICLLMGILPIAKAPLVVKPVITAIEQVFNIDPLKTNMSLKKLSVKLFVVGLIFIISLCFNSFGRIMAFLGSAICFTICITLPLLFYLHIFDKELTSLTRFMLKCGIVLSFGCAVIGTWAAFYVEI